ncbi:MAG: S41 family peptidase [Candidatus Kapabacteria bacterium]|nr:S41 family peptidase [Candidatus Kapabacteria bacterium]
MKKNLTLILTIFLGIMIGFFLQPVISGDSIYNQVKKLDLVLNTAFKNYVEEVDTQKMVEAAIRGMLNELDPHSVFIPAEDMKRVNEDFQGSFEGIGVEFDILNDTITIVSPIPGGPSESLGILSGDKIVKIDGEDAIGITRDVVPKKLKGPIGTKVAVDIKRQSEKELIHFVITRDKIPLNSVQASFIVGNTDIGLIRVEKFSATTHDEIVSALRDLRAQGMKKLILDLRGNPGGYLNQAYMMADEFLSGGDTVVFTHGRKSGFEESYVSTNGGLFEKSPLIVLVDGGSASASEIVSGAMQDLDRGLIVGVTSYGKGLVQRQYDVGDGSSFRITVSKYYTPSGRCIQRPYKDKDRYHELVGRIDLEEGANVEHALSKVTGELEKEGKIVTVSTDKIIIKNKEDKSDKHGKKLATIDTLSIYHTKKGRMVLAGGGITPDYIIRYDTITKLSRDLRNKNLFFEFESEYLGSNGKNLKAKYKENFKDFLINWNPSTEMMSEFKNFAVKKGVEWNKENFDTDYKYICSSLKANIARAIWDRNKFLQILFTDDIMVNKALNLFPEAEKIANLKTK